MAARVTKAQLQRKVASLNQQMGYEGAGSTPYGAEFNDALVLDAAYGGYKINFVSGSGEGDLSPRGTARETELWLQGFAIGLNYGAAAQAAGGSMKRNARHDQPETDEHLWDMVFGPDATPASVKQDARRMGMSVSQYAYDSVREAKGEGMDLSLYGTMADARDALTRMLGARRY